MESFSSRSVSSWLGRLVGGRGMRDVMVDVRRDKALPSFWELDTPFCCPGFLKDALKVLVMR